MKINVHFTKPQPDTQLDFTSGIASPDITLSLVNRIGLDGKSAYAAAVEKGFEGSEKEWIESITKPAEQAVAAASTAAEAAVGAQAQAMDAARSAKEAAAAASEFETEIERVYETLYFEIENIDRGGNTGTPYKGASMTGGGYVPAGQAMTITGDITAEILFTTSDDITTRQPILSWGTAYNIELINGTLKFSLATPAYIMQNVEANKTYHVVIRYSAANRLRTIFVNGIRLQHTAIPTWAATVTDIRFCRNSNFRGFIHHCRFFAGLLSDDTIYDLWGRGLPHEHTLPAASYTEESGNCRAEYIPAGLDDEAWRDTSGNGYDLQATGSAHPSEQPPQALDRFTITTGFITTPVLESGLPIAIPKGYYIEQMRFFHEDAYPMTDIKATNGDGSHIFFELEGLERNINWVCGPLASGYISNPKGDTVILTAFGQVVDGSKFDITVVWPE